jgi:hypothetical protein
MAEIIVPQMDGKSFMVVDEERRKTRKDRLSSWEFAPLTPKSHSEGTLEERHSVRVYNGPPRILELGCSDGSWCFKIKKEQPDWIVEGVDDVYHWSCHQNGAVLRYNT